MTDHVIHISEEEAARDFPSLLARVRAGVEIVIESDTHPAAVLRAAEPPRRSISESIALAEARTKDLGYKPAMDAGFAADLEEIIRNRKPRDTSAWANILGLILDTSNLIASERRDEGVEDILPRVGRARRDRCCTLGRQRRGADARHLPRQKRRRPRPATRLRGGRLP